ncbi:MAG: hypothetical protein FWE23_05175 [Chitinivibrionia bacterium]|nr:hypothetical protein [Chitinivibrionia bacterium]
MSVRYKAGSFECGGGFVRSILREKTNGDEQILLVNTNKTYSSPDDAAILAKTDIEQSLAYAQSGKFQSIDHALSATGYQQIVEEKE